MIELDPYPAHGCLCSEECWCKRMTSRRWKLAQRVPQAGRPHLIANEHLNTARQVALWKQRQQHAHDTGAVRPNIEILYFNGCPNHEPTVALIEQVANDLGLQADLRMVEVTDAETAKQKRFLGSPTVRIHGTDIEPNVDDRADFGMTCRVFQVQGRVSPTPDPQWIVDALLRPYAEQALEAAGIPVARTGKSRTSRLESQARDLYRDIMQAFARGRTPQRTDFPEGLDDCFATLADEDLVHLDSDGKIGVAYPFSGRQKPHRVRIGDNDSTRAMCAVDALGMSAMFDSPVEIESVDPVTGEGIRVRAQPGKPTTWEPTTAVVVAGSATSDGPAHCSCCDVLNFFANHENAKEYLNTHPEITGYPVPIPVAETAGRIIFGEALRGA